MLEEMTQTSSVPIDIVQPILREHSSDETATITAFTSKPLAHEGTNDSTSLFRVEFTWQALQPTHSRTETWIVKHWQAGGVRDGGLDISQSREVLAWQHGWLRPEMVPSGVVVPFLGAWRSPDGSEAWLAMEDVSAELSAYPRFGLSGEHAIAHAKAILAQLARFHVAWEQSEYLTRLQTAPWLRRPEAYLWDQAATFAHALGERPASHMPQAVHSPPVWDGLQADLRAFLEACPLDEQLLWKRLLIERSSLVEGLANQPHTLLHNDLDDRNIGLRWPVSPAHEPQPELVLIDWEWMALGPAVLDVANIVHRIPITIIPGTPIPQAVWGDDLAAHYFHHYQTAGGKCNDAAQWRRAYGMAIVAQGLVQMPIVHGSMLRALNGDIPLPRIVGVPEDVVRQNLRAGLPMMKHMEQRVMHEMRRWL